MADEASIIELFNGGRPMAFTCAEANTIPKGTITEMATSADRTVNAATNANYPIMGIAAFEKIGGDGSTSISVYTDGIFDVTIGAGARNAGVWYANSAATNIMETAAAEDWLNGSVIGYGIEDTAGSDKIAMRVNK